MNSITHPSILTQRTATEDRRVVRHHAWHVPLLLILAIPGSPAAANDVIEVRSPDEQELGNFGRVLGISDITGDGTPELAVAASHNADPRGPRGAVFVLNGRDFSQVSRADPPYPNPEHGDGGSFGWSRSEIADANGDGVSDLVVGAPFDDRPDNFALGYGRAYIVDPVTGAISRILSAPRPERGTYFGWSVAYLSTTAAGATPRIAVGAPRGSAGGQVHYYSAATAELLLSFRAPAPVANDWFGTRLAAIGDVDGDGRADLAVGAGSEANENDSSIGAAYIMSGETGQLLHRLIPPDVPPNTRFSWSVAGVPDVNGDGKTDVVVGIPFASPAGGLLYSGRVCLFSGVDGQWLRTLTSPAEMVRGFFGWAVAGLPDVTGDGAGELLISAGAYARFGFGERRAYLMNGATGQSILTIQSPNGGEGFGISITGMTNGNGALPAMAVGAPQETPPGSPLLRPGRVYVFPFASTPPSPAVHFLGFTNSGLRLQVTGRAGSIVEIHGSSDLVTWGLIAAPTLADEPVEVEDAAAANLPRRFYQAVERP